MLVFDAGRGTCWCEFVVGVVFGWCCGFAGLGVSLGVLLVCFGCVCCLGCLRVWVLSFCLSGVCGFDVLFACCGFWVFC